jgi:phospholipid/cholesterol/gamma-HCH transport system permease protein
MLALSGLHHAGRLRVKVPRARRALPFLVMGTGTSIALSREDDGDVLRLQGAWRLQDLPELEAQIARLDVRAGPRTILDGSGLEEIDTSAGFALFRAIALAPGSALKLRGMQERHARLLTLVHERMSATATTPRVERAGVLQRIGAATIRIARQLRTHLAFLGVVASEAFVVLRRPGLFRFKETVAQLETVAVDAVPIVALVTFLIGIVFAYLLGVQAQRFGANIFVVDGVGLAICRELSPILVAVIVAGRSGAAFTAQIGSMKVQEETDAISTLGLSPIQVLVIPRLVAIMIGLPLLVFIGDLAGIAGGILVGAWQLEISAPSFVSRLHAVLPVSAFVVGVAKAPVFAAFIATIACRMGLTVSRDARSVGEHTTSTVVQSIVWVIVLDAVFAVALQRLGV